MRKELNFLEQSDVGLYNFPFINSVLRNLPVKNFFLKFFLSALMRFEASRREISLIGVVSENSGDQSRYEQGFFCLQYVLLKGLWLFFSDKTNIDVLILLFRSYISSSVGSNDLNALRVVLVDVPSPLMPIGSNIKKFFLLNLSLFEIFEGMEELMGEFLAPNLVSNRDRLKLLQSVYSKLAVLLDFRSSALSLSEIRHLSLTLFNFSTAFRQRYSDFIFYFYNKYLEVITFSSKSMLRNYKVFAVDKNFQSFFFARNSSLLNLTESNANLFLSIAQSFDFQNTLRQDSDLLLSSFGGFVVDMERFLKFSLYF